MVNGLPPRCGQLTPATTVMALAMVMMVADKMAALMLSVLPFRMVTAVRLMVLEGGAMMAMIAMPPVPRPGWRLAVGLDDHLVRQQERRQKRQAMVAAAYGQTWSNIHGNLETAGLGRGCERDKEQGCGKQGGGLPMTFFTGWSGFHLFLLLCEC